MFQLMKRASKAIAKSKIKNNEDEGKLGPAQLNDIPAESKEKNMEKQEGTIKDLGKLFVGGLSQLTTDEKLEAYFSRFGKVIDTTVPRFRKIGKSQGFGFVTFANPEDAKAALQIRVHSLDGKLIELRPFNSKRLKENSEARVFLGGLPFDMSEETLREFFSRYGEVVEVVIPLDKDTNKNKGYGFLVFAEQQAAEKCIADQFVFLRGRRVHIDQAKPKDWDQSGNSDSLSWDTALETNTYEALNDEEEDNEEAQSDVSGNEYLAIEQNSEFKALFKNYFLEKLESFDNMNEKALKNENETRSSQDYKLSEVEKLLSGALNLSNSNTSASVPDLLQFSSESETETESESDDDIADCFPSDLSKAHILNGEEASSIQKPLPLQIRNSEGFLMCSVCQWISPNDSMESFLAHCKTSLHKAKLKDRFPSEQTDKKFKEIDSKPKVPEKPSASSSAKTKTQNKDKKIKKNEKKQQPSAVANKKNKEQTNPANKVKDVKQTPPENENLKILALVKGMASIQTFSKGELMCKMCNKKIPKAQEVDVLMKNVSAHLHSKMHLRKLSETENLLSLCKAMPSLTNKDKENQKQNNPKNKKKQEKSEKKCHEGAAKNKAPPAGKPQNVPIEKFLCLPCNVKCDSIEVFNVHVKLKSHSDNLANKNVKADVSMANMGKCKGCKFYLCGSLYQINKHYSKCVEK